MRRIIAAVLALSMLCICSCSKKDEATIQNDYPVTVYGVTVDACPQRVVSLSPAATEIITALGSYAQLFGVSDNCTNVSGLAAFGTSVLTDEQLRDIVLSVFNLRPAAIIEKLRLRNAIYEDTAVYGHFNSCLFPWEDVNMYKEIRKAAEKYVDRKNTD